MHQNRVKKFIIAAAKIALVAAVLWGMQRTIRSALADLEQHAWSAASLNPGWLVVSGAAYLAGLFPQALFWHRLLGLFGQPASMGGTIRAWYIGSLGKYVPGKATVIVLRTALLRRDGVGIAVSTATIFYETLTTMAVGAFVAGGILLVMRHDRWQWTVLSAGLMIVAGAPTVPWIFKRLARLAGIERAAPAAVDRLDHLGLRGIAGAWAQIGGGWLLVGLSIWAALCAIDGEASHAAPAEIALSIAAAALSIVAGFVSFIPAGLVVRDAVMLELLAPAVGKGPALVCALVARLVWLLSEVGISIILYAMGKQPPDAASKAR
ncbi:MAG TPA: lysylphosphatidylglycerol synthase domain-containing protein [Pirellulales bacterium]|nr:lysylphosphatidylglycerol synthase domain-containing protein [Pirellulales bacterium]